MNKENDKKFDGSHCPTPSSDPVMGEPEDSFEMCIRDRHGEQIRNLQHSADLADGKFFSAYCAGTAEKAQKREEELKGYPLGTNMTFFGIN